MIALAIALLVQADTIEWAKDLDAAMAQSAKDGRPVIAYLTFET
jgi:hypothetical protein